jgi:hypothetical protein
VQETNAINPTPYVHDSALFLKEIYMHTLYLAKIRCALSLTIAFSFLSNAKAADSKAGDEIPDNVYKKVSPQEADYRICGLYLAPGSLIAGTELHVFPDGTAMIAEFSDITSPRLIATGIWRYEDDTLKIQWNHLQQREVLKSSMVPKHNGDTRQYVMYSGISIDGKTVKYFLVPPDTQPVERSNLISQFLRYPDWQKIKSTYLEQTEKGSFRPK